MKTRITQEEAYNYLKSLPSELTLEEYKQFSKKSLHLRLTPDGLKYVFTEEPLENTYHIEKFRLSFFYKGQEVKKRVPLQVGSMALWTTIYQYMAQVEVEERENKELPFSIKELRYLGTTDESEGVTNISSNVQLPYRLTHSFLTPKDEDVLYIEDVYPDSSKPKATVIYKQKHYGLNYLEADKLAREVVWLQNKESELSKILKEERELYNSIDFDEWEDEEDWEDAWE